MKRFSGNEKTLIQNEDHDFFLNEVECEAKVMEEIEKNPSLQTKQSSLKK